MAKFDRYGWAIDQTYFAVLITSHNLRYITYMFTTVMG